MPTIFYTFSFADTYNPGLFNLLYENSPFEVPTKIFTQPKGVFGPLTFNEYILVRLLREC